MLDPLYARVDAFFRAAAAARPGAIACGPRCDGCCRVDLSVFPVEAERIAAAFAALPPRTRAAAARRAESGRHCAMLDPRRRQCVVYPARPLICRTHGLAILADGRLDHCPWNYRDGPPDRANVLVLDRVNEPLAVADRLSGGTGSRVRIAAIAAAAVALACAGAGGGAAAASDASADPTPDAIADAIVDAVAETDADADVPTRTTPGGLPLGLPFRYERPQGNNFPNDEEVAETTARFTEFMRHIKYFQWATDTSAGMDASTGYPDFLIWWHDFAADKAGDTVTFRANKADGGSHNNAVPTGTVLAGALAGYLASGDESMRYATVQYVKSLTACMKGFVFDAADPIDFLMARNVIGRNHAFVLPGGRKKAVDYTEFYFPYEGWNADRFRYEHNPTWGDVWVTSKRSKDDLPYWWRVAAWLPYVVELSPDPGVRDAAAEALDLLRKSARDIVDSGWKVRTKDAAGKAFVPEDQDLASLTAYVDLFPDAECDARLATALLGYGEPHGVDCGSGQGSLYDRFAGAGHYFNYDIVVHFHLAAALLALTNGHADVAEPLVRGLATRFETYRDPDADEPGRKDPSWDRDNATWLLRAAAVGLPLTGDEARLVMRFHAQSVDAYESFPNWDLWSAAVPDGTYSWRDGFHPAHRPDALRAEDLATVIEYCFSPFRNTGGARFVDCDVVLDPSRWGKP